MQLNWPWYSTTFAKVPNQAHMCGRFQYDWFVWSLLSSLITVPLSICFFEAGQEYIANEYRHLIVKYFHDLPDGWTTINFQKIVESFKRRPFGSAIKKTFFVPDGYKVYEQKNAIYNDPHLGNYYIDEKKYRELEAFHIKPQDFIVSCSGTLDKICRIPENAKPGVINQALLRIRFIDRLLHPKLFLYLFRSYFFQELISVEARGSAMKNIAGVKDLKLISIHVPPFNEQKRILDKIEELFADLD
ncbi:MAG: restriction endonuclease subunit S [Cyanobacteria bacterium P01_F01_bin.150]